MRRFVATAVPLLLLFSAATASARPADPQDPASSAPLLLTFIEPALSVPAEVVKVEVHFNPKELTVDKSVPWGHKGVPGGDAPPLEFTHGEPYKLQVELMFDGYEDRVNLSGYGAMLEKLVAPPDAKRPPTVLLQWGSGLTFKCVLESFSLRFTLFLDDGTPVRAVMDAVFKEFTPAQDQTRGEPRH